MIFKHHFFIFSLLVCIIGCKKNASPYTENISIEVDSISPIEGNYRTVINLYGNNFEKLPNDFFITINGKSCSIINKSNHQLIISIPARAGSGKFQLHYFNQVSYSTDFTFQNTYQVSTIAGDGNIGLKNGQGTQAQFFYPVSIIKDSKGDYLITDYYNHVIRKMDANYNVTTYAGTGIAGFKDGDKNTAKFSFPSGTAIDKNDNIYIADTYNNKIRKISNTGIVSTIAGSSAGYADGNNSTAKFNQPKGIALDAFNNLFIVDYNNDRIRKLTTTGMVETYAGSVKGFSDGVGTAAKFNFPATIVCNSNNSLFVADASNNRIRKIDINKNVTTLAGDGSIGLKDGNLANCKFNEPKGVYLDNHQNVWVGDFANHVIRYIDGDSITTLIGSTQGYMDGENKNVKFNFPGGMLFENDSTILMCDVHNQRIRMIKIR